MRVGTEALGGLDTVLVDDTQRTEALVFGIVVPEVWRFISSPKGADSKENGSHSKGESVESLEPAMVGVAALMGRTRGEANVGVKRRQRCSSHFQLSRM